MKLPAIPGMDEFEGKAFHTARWDYEYTGGAPGRPAPHQARRQGRRRRRRGRERRSRRSRRSPSRRSTCTCSSARRRRSASAATARPTSEFAEQLRPGWQKERMENFSAVMIGRPVERDLVDDGWTLHTARVNNPVDRAGDDARRHRGDGRGVRLRGDGGAPARGSRSSSPIPPSPRCSSRTTATGASGPASTTSTSPRSTSPT